MARSAKNNKPFKDALIRFYGEEEVEEAGYTLRCMLMNRLFPQHCVVAAHLVPSSLKPEAQVDLALS